MHEYRLGRSFLFRLEHGADLEPALTEFIRKHDIRLGTVTLIGAVYNATVGYYDHERRMYEILKYDHGLEISSGVGNISLRDGQPFLHLHVALTDEKGNTTGGHVMPGTKVFACEVFIQELIGAELSRTFDEQTGLYLWPQ